VSEFTKDGPLLRQLRVLTGLKDGYASHVQLARLAGVSPAMIHSYLTRFLRDGFVARVGDTGRNVSYRLTPQGQTLRERLLVDYNAGLIRLCASARQEISSRIREILPKTSVAVSICPAGDTSEVVLSMLDDMPWVRVSGVFDDDANKQGSKTHGHTIRPLCELATVPCDGVMIASVAFAGALEVRVKETLGAQARIWRLF